MVGLLAGAWAGIADAGPIRWDLALEGGPEYDTNIHRFDSFANEDDLVAAPLIRGAVRLRTAWRPRPRHGLLLSAFGGAKAFATERGRDENTSAAALDGRYHWRLPGRDAELSARGSYHETFGYTLLGSGLDLVSQRNFRLAGGELALTLTGPEGHGITLWGGYRGFVYKPDHDFDWRGNHAGMRYRVTRWLGDEDPASNKTSGEASHEASIEITASYSVERRAYDSHALRRIPCPAGTSAIECLRPTASMRADLYHTAAAEITYTGRRIYSGRYELQVTDSNSHGQSLVRQRVELDVTSELPGRVFATGRAGLLIAAYRDSLFLAPDGQSGPPDDLNGFVTIDDENRSFLSVHLARDIDTRWSLEGRYALYLRALASDGPGFRRQLVYLGVVCRYGS